MPLVCRLRRLLPSILGAQSKLCHTNCNNFIAFDTKKSVRLTLCFGISKISTSVYGDAHAPIEHWRSARHPGRSPCGTGNQAPPKPDGLLPGDPGDRVGAATGHRGQIRGCAWTCGPWWNPTIKEKFRKQVMPLIYLESLNV